MSNRERGKGGGGGGGGGGEGVGEQLFACFSDTCMDEIVNGTQGNNDFMITGKVLRESAFNKTRWSTNVPTLDTWQHYFHLVLLKADS